MCRAKLLPPRCLDAIQIVSSLYYDRTFVRFWQDENIDYFIMVYFCLVRMLGDTTKTAPKRHCQAHGGSAVRGG